MSRLSQLAVLGLAALVTPGVVEVTENLWHLATRGHEAHAAEAGADHAPDGREHGCSGTFHLCTCCHTAPAAAAPPPSSTIADAPEPSLASGGGAAPRSPFLPPLDRPPQV